jgi:hypothetical protein
MDGWYATSRTRQRIRPTKVTRRRYSATWTAANKQIRKSHIETKMGRAATILNSCPKQGRKGLFFYFFIFKSYTRGTWRRQGARERLQESITISYRRNAKRKGDATDGEIYFLNCYTCVTGRPQRQLQQRHGRE